MRTTNMAVLAVRGAGSSEVERAVQARRGKAGGTAHGLPLFGFTSPTDAVLVGLELARGVPGAAAAVTAGEVAEASGTMSGRAVEAAADLAATARDGEVLLTEAVFFAMNRNEVGAVPTDLPQKGPVDQRVYRAEGRVPTRADEAAKPAPVPTGSGARDLVPMVGILLAFGVGYLLHGTDPSRLPGLGDELPGAAQALAGKGQHREAAHAFKAAWRAHPGRTDLERGYRESTLAAAREFEKGGRADAAFHLLYEATGEDPFRPDLEAALYDTGLRYLGQLASVEASRAPTRAEEMLVSRLPLREKDLRDRLIEIKVERILVEWRQVERANDLYDVEKKLDPLYKLNPQHPALFLAWGEFASKTHRMEYVAQNFRKALQKRPEWASEKPAVAQAALRVFERMDEASDRRHLMEPHVDFCVQMLAPVLTEPLKKALAGERVGPRVGAFKFFSKLGGLDEEQRAAYHEANLAGVSEVGETEGPLKDAELVREALAYAAGRPDRARWVRALDKALAVPDVPAEIRDQLMAARQKLESGG